MTLKNYLILMLATTLVCWGIFGFVLFTIDPFATNLIGFILFYSALFLAIMGTSSIVGFLVRFSLLKQKLAFRAVSEAFRQSFLFSFLISFALFLLSKNLFTWLNLIFLVGALALAEFCLISTGRAKITEDSNS